MDEQPAQPVRTDSGDGVPGSEKAARSRPLIAAWLPCVGCGYDLKSLALAGRCPECGRACEDSLRSLAAAEWADLVQVGRGLRVMALAGVVPPLAAIAFTLIDIERNTNKPELTQLGLLGIGVIGPLAAQWGLGMVCALVRPASNVRAGREAATLGAEGKARVLGRVYVAFSALVTLLILLGINDVVGPGENDSWGWVLGVCLVGTGLGWTLRNVLVSRRCARIAALSNATGIRRTFASLMWVSVIGAAIVACYGLTALLSYVYREELFMYQPGPRTAMVMTVVLVAQVVAMVVNGAGLAW